MGPIRHSHKRKFCGAHCGSIPSPSSLSTLSLSPSSASAREGGEGGGGGTGNAGREEPEIEGCWESKQLTRIQATLSERGSEEETQTQKQTHRSFAAPKQLVPFSLVFFSLLNDYNEQLFITQYIHTRSWLFRFSSHTRRPRPVYLAATSQVLSLRRRSLLEPTN